MCRPASLLGVVGQDPADNVLFSGCEVDLGRAQLSMAEDELHVSEG